ncbi:MAG: hypothetical protein ACJ74O_17770 [Frankiaceae bacterium]
MDWSDQTLWDVYCVTLVSLVLLIVVVAAVGYLIWRVEWYIRQQRQPTIDEQGMSTAAYIHDLGQWAREQMLRDGQR